MLPESIGVSHSGTLFYRFVKRQLSPQFVLDTELLHLCWLVEGTLDDGGTGDEPPEVCGTQVMEYVGVLASDTEFSTLHATWQQRTIALCKVKGVEIV